MGRQIVVVDLAHCGTTMVAGVLERIGVPMMLGPGKRYKLEDGVTFDALQDDDKFGKLVQQRSSLPVWGFKRPGAWKYAPTLRKHLPDPVFVAIYKDPWTVTLRRFGTVTLDKLESTAQWMTENIKGLKATGLPVETFSYLDAVRNPCQFTTRLARLAGVVVTGGQMDSVLEWMFPVERQANV